MVDVVIKDGLTRQGCPGPVTRYLFRNSLVIRSKPVRSDKSRPDSITPVSHHASTVHAPTRLLLTINHTES